MSNIQLIEIPLEHDKNRVDKALSELMPDVTRSKIQSLIDKQAIFINQTPVSVYSHKVKEGEVYSVEILGAPPSDLVPKDIPLDILYEDNDLIVVNKQAGLTTHPGAGNTTDTLVNALLAHCGQNLSTIGEDQMRPGIVHRLDKNTSGVMVVAKNDFAHAHLAKQIQDKELTRQYTAVVYGTPKPLKGTYEAHIGRSSKDRKKMAVVMVGGKDATTHYEVLEILSIGSASVLKCILDTGRTHQIRVHLTHFGFPLIGDPEYGNVRNKRTRGFSDEAQAYMSNFKRQALHSTYIKFTHPVTQETLDFTAKLPEDMTKLIEILRYNG